MKNIAINVCTILGKYKYNAELMSNQTFCFKNSWDINSMKVKYTIMQFSNAWNAFHAHIQIK